MKSIFNLVLIVLLVMLIAPIVYATAISSDVEVQLKIRDISGTQKISKSTSAILTSVGMGQQNIVFCGKKPFQVGVSGVNYESSKSDDGRCRYIVTANPPGEYFKIYSIVGDSSFSYGYGQRIYRIYHKYALIELFKVYIFIAFVASIYVMLATVKKKRVK